MIIQSLMAVLQPLTIILVAIGTVILPQLSRNYADADAAGYS